MGKEIIIEILNSDARYMFLAALISAETNHTESDIKNNLGILEECKAITEEKEYAEKINNLEEVIEFLNRGFEILNTDLHKLST